MRTILSYWCPNMVFQATVTVHYQSSALVTKFKISCSNSILRLGVAGQMGEEGREMGIERLNALGL